MEFGEKVFVGENEVAKLYRDWRTDLLDEAMAKPDIMGVTFFGWKAYYVETKDGKHNRLVIFNAEGNPVNDSSSMESLLYWLDAMRVMRGHVDIVEIAEGEEFPNTF